MKHRTPDALGTGLSQLEVCFTFQPKNSRKNGNAQNAVKHFRKNLLTVGHLFRTFVRNKWPTQVGG